MLNNVRFQDSFLHHSLTLRNKLFSDLLIREFPVTQCHGVRFVINAIRNVIPLTGVTTEHRSKLCLGVIAVLHGIDRAGCSTHRPG